VRLPANKYASTARILQIAAFMLFVGFFPSGAHCADDSNAVTEQGVTEGMWDRYHDYLATRINEPVIWFDNFFGDPRTEDKTQPTSFVRLRTAARFTESLGFRFPVRLYANLKLPKASRRLRLVITGENKNEAEIAKTDSSSVAALNTLQEDKSTNLGLRYMIYDTLRTTLHFGGGMRLQWPLDYYFRIRYERLLHIGSKSIVRLSETGFWQSLDGFGETTRFDFERTLNDTISNRFSMFGTYSEISEGLEWGVEESVFKQLSPKSAVSLDLGSYGRTDPSTRIINYRIASRYRQNFLRPWLFFEVEPEVTFPLELDDTHSTVGAITFYLEVQFLAK